MSKQKKMKFWAVLCLGVILAFSSAMLVACKKEEEKPQTVTYEVTFDSQGGSAVAKQTV